MASNPYVNKVQTADGTTLIDISDTTALATDVLNGKAFYAATGQKITGSAIKGLEYETGTFTPESDITRPYITFANAHSTRPGFVLMSDVTGTTATDNSVMVFADCDSSMFLGDGVLYSDTLNYATMFQLHHKVETLSSSLPAGYQQVGYLESNKLSDHLINLGSGTQPTDETRTICRFQLTDSISSSMADGSIFGARASSTSKAYVFSYTSTKFRFNYTASNATAQNWYDVADVDNYIHTIDINGRYVYFDGVLVLTADQQDSFRATNLFRLFGAYGSSKSYPGKVRIYSVKVSKLQNSQGVTTPDKDLVPCIRTSDSVPGFYDLNNQTFYSPSGTLTYGNSGHVVNSAEIETLTGSGSKDISYWVTGSGFYPYITNSRYFRAGRTYKWVAVWAPTS